MATRTTDEFGTSTFEHDGWTITTYDGRDAVDVTVHTKRGIIDIDASYDEDGLNLCGTSNLHHDGLSAYFTVPWEVLAELVRIRQRRADNPFPAAACTRCGSDDPQCICYAR